MSENKTQETVRLVCQHQGFNSLDEDMLQKLVYLADFVACSKLKHQITECSWYLKLSGPFSPEVSMLLSADSSLRVETIDTIRLVRLSTRSLWSNVSPSLQEVEKAIVKTVVDYGKHMYAGDFLTLVSSTYKFARVVDPNTAVSLPDLVEQYKSVRNWLHTSPTKAWRDELVHS